MEFFTILRENLAESGIEISQKLPTIHPFNVKNSSICILICFTISLITGSLNEAISFDDSIYILNQCNTFGICGIIFAIIVWNTSELFEFINSLSNIVNRS